MQTISFLNYKNLYNNLHLSDSAKKILTGNKYSNLSPLNCDTTNFKGNCKTSFKDINFEEKFSPNNLDIINKITKLANKLGVNVYLVGGIVRDIVLGEEANDLDFLVEGDAIKFAKNFHEKYPESVIEYLKQDFATAKIRINGEDIDLASTREESYIRKGVPNVSNVGCSIAKDIKRRDFTINSMALKLVLDKQGKTCFVPIDIAGGLCDISNKIISATYDDSFNDDPTRILRGLKFRLRYSFKYDAKTQKMQDDFLKNPPREQISMSRVETSLREKLFKNKNIAPLAYKAIIQEGLYKLFTSEILAKAEWAPRIEQACEIFEINNIANVYMKMLDNNVILTILENYDNNQESTNYEIFKSLSKKTNEDLAVYYSITGDKNAIKYFNELKHKTLFVNGKMLIQMGIKPGKHMGLILDELLKAKLNGNNIQTLEDEKNFIKKFI